MTDKAATDKAALVTGASQGIGERLAGFLAGRGYGVSMVSRGTQGLLAQAAQALADTGAEVAEVRADLRDAGEIRAAVQGHERRFGRLDVLVHCAGALSVGPLSALTDEALDEVFEVNLRAGVLLLRESLPLLEASAAAGARPLVVLLGSTAGLGGAANLAAYSASKFGVVGFADAMAKELAPRGVRVTALCPDRVASTKELADDPDLISLADVEQAFGLLLDLSPAVSAPVLPLRLARP